MAATSDIPTKLEPKYALLSIAVELFETAAAIGYPIASVQATGVKKVRIVFNYPADVEKAPPTLAELKPVAERITAQIKQGGALAGHQHDISMVKDVKVTTVNDKRKDKGVYEVLLNITGSLPTGTASTKAAKGENLARKGVSSTDLLAKMPVLQKDDIQSAINCLLFEVDFVLATSSASSSPAASSSSSPPSLESLTPEQKSRLAERLGSVLLQFKNNAYSSGFIAASSSK